MPTLPDDLNPASEDLLAQSFDLPDAVNDTKETLRVSIVKEGRHSQWMKVAVPLIVILVVIAFVVGQTVQVGRQNQVVPDGGAKMSRRTPQVTEETSPARRDISGTKVPPIVVDGNGPEHRSLVRENGKAKAAEVPVEIRLAAEKEKARLDETEAIMAKAREDFETKIQDRSLKTRLVELHAMRPIPMDELHAVQRVILRQNLEREVRKFGQIPQGRQDDALGLPGAMWKGQRSYREGMNLLKTVDYELHIRERDGYKFKGMKYDNGPRRNEVDVEGWVVGKAISWIETHRISLFTVTGTIDGDRIRVNFMGIYKSGIPTAGDASLDRDSSNQPVVGFPLVERAQLAPPAVVQEPIDRLAAGTIWKGEKHFRGGAYAGIKVSYELHVTERNGKSFKGHKFNKGTGRNRSAVEGMVEGNAITWHELSPNNHSTMKGIINKNTIAITFDGAFTNEGPSSGDATLILESADKDANEGENASQKRLESEGFDAYWQGLQLSTQGRFAEAQGCFEHALIILKKRYPDEKSQSIIVVLQELGLTFRYQGKLYEALDSYRSAIDLHKILYPNSLEVGLATLYSSVGMVLMEQGKHTHALAYCQKALDIHRMIYQGKDEASAISIINNLGSVLSSQGESLAALSYYRQALEMSQRIYSKEDRSETAKGFVNVGAMLADLGEHNQALDYLRQALEMKKRIFGNRDHPEIAKILPHMGGILLSQKKYKDAGRYFRMALEMNQRLYLKKDHPSIIHNLTCMAVIMKKEGRATESAYLLSEALSMSERLYPAEQYKNGHRDILTILFSMGELLYSEGQTKQALSFLQRAIAMDNAISSTFLATASEAESLNFKTGLPLSANLLLSIAHHTQSGIDSLYQSLWNSKASIAQMGMLRQRALLQSSDEKTQAIGRDLITVRRKLSSMLLSSTSPSAGSSEQIDQLTKVKEQLERQLSDLLPEFRRKMNRNSRTSADLSHNLPSGTVFIDLLQYLDDLRDPNLRDDKGLILTPSYVAFVLRPGQAAIPVFLGASRPIEDALADWRAQITDEKRSDTESIALRATLRSLIWDKVEPLFPPNTTTVLISPDSALCGLPWAAMPGRDPKDILLKDYALATVPSATFLLEWLESSRKLDTVSGTLLCVGDVSYSPNKQEGIWKPLEATRNEIAAIAKMANPRKVCLLTESQADTATVIDMLPRSRWTHLATHGFFADRKFLKNIQLNEDGFFPVEFGGHRERFMKGSRSPMVLSGLVLAGANLFADKDEFGLSKGDGGILTAEAIAGLPLQNLELVVLSACETGLGDVSRGEGVFGLQRAFHMAGTPSVIGSLWGVKSKATATLMERFYQKLWGEAKTPMVALREAQLDLYDHPELIDKAGFNRGPDLSKAVSIKDINRSTSALRHTPTRLWAGFFLSGPGQKHN